jgi:hypothetical protein
MNPNPKPQNLIMSQLHRNNYTREELLTITGNLTWSSHHFPEGILLKEITRTHLINAINYIRRRIKIKGDIVSSRQEPFKYSEWLSMMCLHLYNTDNTSEELLEPINQVKSQVAYIVKRHGLTLHSNKLVYMNGGTTITTKKEKDYIYLHADAGGVLASRNIHSQIKELAKQQGRKLKDIANEAFTDLFNKYNNPERETIKAEVVSEDAIPKTKLYVCYDYGDDREETAYAVLGESSIHFTYKSEATLFNLDEALALQKVFKDKAIYFKAAGYYIMFNGDYLNRQEGWVSWTSNNNEADVFNSQEEAEAVIAALTVVFGGSCNLIVTPQC